MGIESVMDAILLLLYAKGTTGEANEKIRGITRLEKLIYLLRENKTSWKFLEEISFEPYDYGPFSSDVYDGVEALKSYGLLKVETMPIEYYSEIADGIIGEQDGATEDSYFDKESDKVEIYSLTEKGLEVAEALFHELLDEEKEGIGSTKLRFNSMPFLSLLRYVYSRHPESATKSKIRDKLFKNNEEMVS